MADGHDFDAQTIAEMNDKEKSGAYKVLSATRKGKLGHCTRKMNEIKAMCDAGFVAIDVRQSISDFLKMLDEFKVYHETVQLLLTVEEKEEATSIEQETLGTTMSYLAALSQNHAGVQPLTVERISQESARDSTISSLVSLIQKGCPEKKEVWPKDLEAFHQYRADLTTADCMVLY